MTAEIQPFDGEIGTVVDSAGELWFVSLDLQQGARLRHGVFDCYDFAVGLTGWCKGGTPDVRAMASWVAHRVLPRFAPDEPSRRG